MRPLALSAILAAFAASGIAADPLPSWAETENKRRIIEFVDRVTDPRSTDYVTPSRRIATFDNDGTLWAEQPVYFQLVYAIDRLLEKASADPSILSTDALRAAAAGDMEGMLASGVDGLKEVLAVSHAGVTIEEFQADVRDWLATATHPDTGLLYGEMIYQPMLELLSYLRDEGFQTWIASGGGVHFLRVFAEDTYGIPPEQVIGSTTPSEYDEALRKVTKQPGIAFVDDKAGKPVGIDTYIGRKPLFAAGNSDGDFQMLEYTTAEEDGTRLALIVHHTDAEREYAYDRDSHIGKLVRGLDEGPDRGWVIVDMAKDWTRIWSVQP
ncbi:MAG: HAD family hydrolase [Pseudomonadota bacterium]